VTYAVAANRAIDVSVAFRLRGGTGGPCSRSPHSTGVAATIVDFLRPSGTPTLNRGVIRAIQTSYCETTTSAAFASLDAAPAASTATRYVSVVFNSTVDEITCNGFDYNVTITERVGADGYETGVYEGEPLKIADAEIDMRRNITQGWFFF
jgi:hypothetical protein